MLSPRQPTEPSPTPETSENNASAVIRPSSWPFKFKPNSTSNKFSHLDLVSATHSVFRTTFLFPTPSLSLSYSGPGPLDLDGDDFNPEPIDPNMCLEKIGGLEEQIAYLRSHILHPISDDQEPSSPIARAALKPVKGVIFHGPPGTGKTVLAKALATTASHTTGKNVNFFIRKGTDFSPRVDQCEKNLWKLFAKAERMAPSIIFLDEIEELCPKLQDSLYQHRPLKSATIILSYLLENMKPGKVYVIGATNQLSSLDPAILRYGRFDQKLQFSAPSEAERLHILNIKLTEWGHSKPNNDLLQEVARDSVDFSGADLEKLISTTLDLALERQLPKFGTSGDTADLEALQVTREDWLKALVTTSKSIPNVFGIPSYTGTVMHEIIRPLIVQMVQEIRERIESMASLPDVSLGNKGLLVWAPSTILAINNHLLPAVIWSMNTRKFPTFRLRSHEDIYKVLDQALHSAREHPTILLIPRIDRILVSLQTKNAVDLLLESFEQARGKNLTILASAMCGVPNLDERLQDIFGILYMSYQLPAVTNEARKAFFAPLFDKNSKYHEKHGNLQNLSELLCRVEQMTDGYDISKLINLLEELRSVCIRFYYRDSGSRNSDGYKIMIQEFVAVFKAHEKAKTATSC